MLKDTIRQIVNVLKAELEEAGTLLRRAGFLPPDTYMRENFLVHGKSFNADSIEVFTAQAQNFYNDAKKFYENAKVNNNNDPSHQYSFIQAGYGRVAIDLNGEIRGIFTDEGRPLAFFRPNYRQLGYESKEDELKDFRRGQAFTGWRVHQVVTTVEVVTPMIASDSGTNSIPE